jgi:hypothetical protein
MKDFTQETKNSDTEVSNMNSNDNGSISIKEVFANKIEKEVRFCQNSSINEVFIELVSTDEENILDIERYLQFLEYTNIEVEMEKRGSGYYLSYKIYLNFTI